MTTLAIIAGLAPVTIVLLGSLAERHVDHRVRKRAAMTGPGVRS